MTIQTDRTLLMQSKAIFASAFPKHAAQFEKAQTDEERFAIYEDLLAFSKKQYMDLTGEDPQGSATYVLTPTQYQSLTQATGDQIAIQIQTIVNTLSLVQNMKDKDQIAAQMFNAGVFVFSAAAVTAFNAGVTVGMAILDAAAGAIATVGTAPVVALVVAVIVAVLVPFLYFMFKPAYTFVMLINQTDKALTWGGDYEVHGKLTNFVDTIPVPSVFTDKTLYTAGFVAGSKRDNALVGCQMGFIYQYDSKTNFAYGVESPLTSIYVDNNCYCDFNVTAEQIANTTDSKNVLTSTATLNNFSSKITCANKSGDGAWCLAQAILT
jgi:hypothetical protein